MAFTPNQLDNRLLYRMKEAVRQVELERNVGPSLGPNNNTFVEWWAFTQSGGIPAGTDAPAVDSNGNPLTDQYDNPINCRTPGSASCNLYSADGNGKLQPYMVPDPASTTSPPASIQGVATVYNWSSTAISQDLYIEIEVRANRFYLKAAECVSAVPTQNIDGGTW